MKKGIIFFSAVTFLFWMVPTPNHIHAEAIRSQLLVYAGKSFTGIQDPEYIAYDNALREYMIKRVQKRFGISLDPKKYCGPDLLEIEALFKCKKSDEPYELFLKMFPKTPSR